MSKSELQLRDLIARLRTEDPKRASAAIAALFAALTLTAPIWLTLAAAGGAAAGLAFAAFVLGSMLWRLLHALMSLFQ